MKQPNTKELRKLLSESLVNPKSPGVLKTIIEQNDANYFEMRAQELITEARLCLGNDVINNPIPNEHQVANYNDRIIKAISLLTLARYKRSIK